MSDEVRMAREIAEIIRDAILAERERCAQIAENNEHFPQEGQFIAAAIRQDRGE